MKRLFFLLPILILGISSCQKIKEEIKEATTTTVTTNISVPLRVDKIGISPQGDSSVFNIEEQYPISDNQIIQAYKEKIKDVDIVGLQVKVVNANPTDMVLQHAKFILQEVNTTNSFECNITKPFLLTVGNMYVVKETDANWQVINDIIEKLGDIKVRANGVVVCPSDAFVYVDFEFIIKVRATINVEI